MVFILHVFCVCNHVFCVVLRSQEALKTGHFVSVLQVLMHLQRVCDHPDLVAPRENDSAYFCSSLPFNVPSLVLGALQDDADKVYIILKWTDRIITSPLTLV